MRTEIYTTPSNKTVVLTFMLLMVISISSIIFEGRGGQGQIHSGGKTVFGGLQSSFAAVGGFFTDTLTSIHELGQLREQYDLLADRLHSMEENITDIDELRAENHRLRNVMQFSASIQYDNTPAQIIAKDPGSLFGTITINKGVRHGLKQGDPVIAIQDGQHGLVGRISYSGRRTSIVQPMFDSRSHVASRLQESRHEGLVSGTGRHNSPLELQFIPQRARSDIRTGDSVITSGMSELFPSGILIGTVSSMQSMPYETSLTIELEPVIDFGRLEFVYVLTETSTSGEI